MSKVLEHVPWSVRCEPAVEEQRSVVRVKWICAAYAARLYARRRQWDDFCELLGLLSHWNAQTGQWPHDNVQVDQWM